jgi:hypothetical protein
MKRSTKKKSGTVHANESPTHEQPTANSVTAIATLFAEARHTINELIQFADADTMEGNYAASALLALVEKAVGNLQFLVESDAGDRGFFVKNPHEQAPFLHPSKSGPSRFEHLARDRESWPVLWNVHKEKRDELERLLHYMNLGCDSALNLAGNGKAFSLKPTANQIVLKLYRETEKLRGGENSGCMFMIMNGRVFTEQDRAEMTKWACDVAAKLPELSREKEVLNKWIAATEELLPFLYGEEFQVHPELACLLSSQDKADLKRWQQRMKIKRKLADAWVGIPRPPR